MDQASRNKWLDSLFNEIRAHANIDAPRVVKMRSRRVLWIGIASAAAILVIFFAVFLQRPAQSGATVSNQLTALNVPLDQKKQVVLADGSKIWVNSLSELKYPQAFNGKTREVYLSGEAYFDIRHDASKPFIIHTGKVITTVLGTAFNIKEDNLQHTIVVTVTRGKVSVANGKSQLGVITPNQQISFNTVNNQHTQIDVDAKKAIAWQESDIHFDDITFAAAAGQLQQRFKVKISFANEKVKNCRFTGTALKEENLDKILKVICAFNNATYQTKADGSIVVDGPGCN
jgi:ferric-dicitrate binding protein FerR (iron transport regulator)